MKTTVELLNEVKVRYNLPSDGRLAAMLGLTRSAISRFMGGKDYLGDETALKVADLLELDPVFVVACVHAERAKRVEEKKLWERMATMASGAGVALFVLLAVPFVTLPPMDTSIVTNQADSGALYIMSNLISDYWAVFAVLFVALLLAFPWHHHHPEKETDKLSK